MKLTQNLTSFAFLLLLYSCNQSDTLKSKIDKSSLMMTRELPQGYQYIEMRCNCPSQTYLHRIENENGFAHKATSISLYFQDILNKVKSKPSLNYADNRVRLYLDSVRNDVDYKMLCNKAAFSILQGYFLQEDSLSNSQKNSLAYYLDLLVQQENANLPELAQALEKMENFWEKSKVKATAQAILSNYALYNEDDFLNLSKLDTIKAPSGMEDQVDLLKNLALRDAAAKNQLLNIITRNQ